MSRPDMEAQCSILRQELKVWEKQFAASNNGRTAGRDDIKADATISQKYKQYNKIRALLSGKDIPQTPSKRAPSRKSTVHHEQTPKGPKSLATTPLKRKHTEVDVAVVECVASPDVRSTPHGPSFIGPTPQRDGKALGLFDLLTSETPIKRRSILGELEPNILQTPSKSKSKEDSETSIENRARWERTPLSSGKRFLFDQFVTPKKRKLDESGTPTSALKGLSTPAFLRRDNHLTLIEEGNELTPRPVPWKRKAFGRSLSSMIQSMRKEEEEREEEEAQILREIEMEAEGIVAPHKQHVLEEVIVVKQAPMPLGPDQGPDEESEDHQDEQQLGPDGQPRRVWKKKGMKRQTKRVNMKPAIYKPTATITRSIIDEKQDNHNGDTPEEATPADADPQDDDSDYASDASHKPRQRPLRQKKANNSQANQAKGSEKGTGQTLKNAARKIKATAHANYKRLKIKSKGGNGGKGRFGKRR